MTALEAKIRYGNLGDGYVNCYNCPLHDSGCSLDNKATGFDDCWNEIAENTSASKVSNPYWERICKLSEAQRKKGMETYGQGLESNPAAMLKRIEHLQEELVDALMYCEWIKDKLGLEGD